jgi:hypothetical protein
LGPTPYEPESRVDRFLRLSTVGEHDFTRGLLRCLGAPFHERDVEYQPSRVFLGSVLDKVHAFDMPLRPIALSEID